MRCNSTSIFLNHNNFLIFNISNDYNTLIKLLVENILFEIARTYIQKKKFIC